MDKYKPFDLVHLQDHTDVYRVYTYKGETIFVGMNSDTVRSEKDATVTEIIQQT